jgi:hypothetical protein
MANGPLVTLIASAGFALGRMGIVFFRARTRDSWDRSFVSSSKLGRVGLALCFLFASVAHAQRVEAASHVPACRSIAERVSKTLTIDLEATARCDFVYDTGTRKVRVRAARTTKTERRSCPKGCVTITEPGISCQVIRNNTTANIVASATGPEALSICRAWFASSSSLT